MWLFWLWWLKLAGAWVLLVGDVDIFLGDGLKLLPAGSAVPGLGGVDFEPAVGALLQFGGRLSVELVDDAVLQLAHGLLILQLLPAAVLMRESSARLQLWLWLCDPWGPSAAAVLILLHEDHVLEVGAVAGAFGRLFGCG